MSVIEKGPIVAAAAAGLAFVFVSARATGQTTECASINALGQVGDAINSYYEPSLSGDGRFAVYASYASNLVPGDTNGAWDVFVRDRALGVTLRASVDSSGAQANGNSGAFVFPQDGVDVASGGRYVAFLSDATNLVPADTNGRTDVFVHDMLTGETTLESLDSAGNQGNDHSSWPVLSANGRYIVFLSWASNLVPGYGNGTVDVFYRDRQAGTTKRVSVSTAGVEGNGECTHPAITKDGRAVGFTSHATNLLPTTRTARKMCSCTPWVTP
jgi:Tol biopolymer transport system component